MLNITLSTALSIFLRTAAVYLSILVLLRLSGKREIGQMTIIDLVVLLLIANAVQNAMTGPDTSLPGGIIAAVTLLLLNLVITRLRLRWPRLRQWVEGTPTLLILHGKVIAEHLQKEGVDEETLLEALREHGVADIERVEMAVLEVDGTISVVPMGETMRHTRKPVKSLRL